ncbi:MAG: endonuclease dU [Candidatus Ranarchaeia archaeon]
MTKIPFHKQGFRVLGIAESFDRKKMDFSVIAGVVMRRDLVIDGFRILTVPLGGKHITNALIDMYHALNRNDVKAIFIQGLVIAWFNIINLEKLHRETGLPIVCITYNPSKGLEPYIREYFPHDFEDRLNQYRQLHKRQKVLVKTGYALYLLSQGISLSDARRLTDIFLRQGRVPEPIRVAQILAREIFHWYLTEKTND